MIKTIKRTAILTIIIAVVFLNSTYLAHASDLDNGSLSTSITETADTTFQQSLIPNQTYDSKLTNTSDTQEVARSTTSTMTEQNINAVANTGNNIAERNISIGGNAGIITTGDAHVVTGTQVNANNTTQSTDMTNHSVLQNSNRDTFIHYGGMASNTGGNTTPRNISIGGQAGVIHTGNAYAGSSYLVSGNNTVALIGGENDTKGPGSGASVILATNGDRHKSTTAYKDQHTTTRQSNNEINVSQICGYCSVDTGHNTSNRNINTKGSAGVIQTGNAVIAMTAGIHGNNSTTSAGTNNIATVDQHMNAQANTGYNEASRNIALGGDAGVIHTGSAYIMALLTGMVNANEPPSFVSGN